MWRNLSKLLSCRLIFSPSRLRGSHTTIWRNIEIPPVVIIHRFSNQDSNKLLHTWVGSKSMIHKLDKEPRVDLTGKSRVPFSVNWIKKDDRCGISQILDIHEGDLVSEEALLNLYERWLSHYNTLDTEHKRFNVFKDNVKHIHSVNNMNKSYKLRLNMFGDLTNHEFQRLYMEPKIFQDQMLAEIQQATSSTSFTYAHVANFPPSADWRKKGDRGKCDASATNKLVRSFKFDRFKCDHICIEGRKCDTEEIALLKAVATRPVLVAIGAGGSDFQFYSEGLFDGELGDELNYVIAIVGYGGVHTNGVCLDTSKRWIIATSLGLDWGENGFMSIKRDVCVKRGLLWIAMMASYLVKISPHQPKWHSNDVEGSSSFQDLTLQRPFHSHTASTTILAPLQGSTSLSNIHPQSFMAFRRFGSSPTFTMDMLNNEPQVAPTNSKYGNSYSTESYPTINCRARCYHSFRSTHEVMPIIIGQLLRSMPKLELTNSNSAVPTLVDWRRNYESEISKGLDVDNKDVESVETLWNLYRRWMKHYGEFDVDDVEHKTFKEFKKNAKHIHRVNSMGGPFKLRLNCFAIRTNTQFERGFLQNKSTQQQAIAEICMRTKASSLRHAVVAKFPPSMKEAVIPVYDCRYQVTEVHFDIFKTYSVKINGGCTTKEPRIVQDGIFDTFKKSEATKSIEGHAMDDESCEVALMKAVSQQPVLVAICTRSLDFVFYSEGVYDGELGEPNSVVAIVGYGVTSDGIKYWIISSTWGARWGEGGFMRIKRGVCETGDLRGMATIASNYLVKMSPP